MTPHSTAIALATGLLLALPAPRLSAPVSPFSVTAAYRPPATAFAPGHRGVDLQARFGQSVRSPLSGVVSFSGTIAGRPVLSIRSGDVVVSLEPVASDLPAGTAVRRDQRVGVVASGGHCAQACIHVGLRIGGRYAPPFAQSARLVPWR